MRIGAPGFEPGTSWSQTKRATGLRYAPLAKETSMLKTLRTTGAIIATVVVAGAPAEAQTSAGLSMGTFTPMGRSLIYEKGGLGGAPVPYPILEKWQSQAFVFAAHVSRKMSPRLALEVKLSQAPGTVTERDSLNHVSHATGFVFMAGARVPIKVTSVNSTFVMQIAPGVKMINRGGRAWAGIGGRGDPALSLSLLGGGLFGRRSKVSSKIDLEGQISHAQFDSPSYGLTSRRLVPELLVSFGFEYRLTRR